MRNLAFAVCFVLIAVNVVLAVFLHKPLNTAAVIHIERGSSLADIHVVGSQGH